MKKLLYILFFLPLSTFAQDYEMWVELSEDTVAQEELIKVSFHINTKSSAFTAPSFNKFRIIEGPYSSSRVLFVNGKATSSSVVSYFLQPLESGEITIEPLTFVIKGKHYNTPATTLWVGEKFPLLSESDRNYFLEQLRREHLGTETLEKQIKITENERYIETKMGETFNVEFTVNVKDAILDDVVFTDFEIVEGPRYSYSAILINKQIENATTVTYVLKAKSIGEFTLNPATIKIDGTVYMSNTINVLVKDSRFKKI